MSELDRLVGGLRCRDVLAVLGDYVDGELEASDVERVHAHLRGCDLCEKFGGEYAALVRLLRKALASESYDRAMRDRLVRRMTDTWSEERWR